MTKPEFGSKLSASNSIKLSPSTLGLFRDCPRCFWLEKIKKIKRPRGIFPSLPGGMDRVIKTYFDKYRKDGSLPPELAEGPLKGTRLFADQALLDTWRDWRTGMEFRDDDGSILMGAVDDLLVTGDLHVPFDYKTKGSPTTQEDAERYYQMQLDCYALLLEKNGHPVAGHGFLMYYSPKTVAEGGEVKFQVQPIRIEVSPLRALEFFRLAVKVLKEPQMPSPGECEYCTWLSRFRFK